MVVTSVSIPQELYTQLINKAISVSKATQIGIKVILEGGGQDVLDSLKKFREQNNSLRENAEMKNEKIKNLTEEVEFLRKTYVTTVKEEEIEKEAEEEADKLLE